MNSLSGFNTQEMRRLHPYLSALLSRLKALEVKVEKTGTKEIAWGGDEDIQPTGNRNFAGEVNRVARADHQHLFKFPTAVPLTTPDGTAFFDVSASAINIYVGNTPTTKVVAGGKEEDVQPTGRRDTGAVPRYSYADHSHPTALLPQNDPQTPVVGELRYNTEDKLVRWDGSEWVPLSVEDAGVQTGVDADVRPTKRLSAGSAPRVARADHSHPTAILPQGDAQMPEADEIRYTTDNKLVRWNATTGQWVPLSVETFTLDWGTDADVQPTRLQSAGSSTRVARADHSHPTAILPQENAQTPVADEIRFSADNKIVRWDGSAWVPLSVETFEVEWGTDDDVEPTRLRSAGASTRFARADHSHPTALLPEDDPQTPVENEIRFSENDKIVRWDATEEEWVPLSVETAIDIDWGTDDDVQPTGLQSTGTATRVARADHSHPTAILPQSDTQTPVENEIRFTAEDKIVRWNGNNWVPLSVETTGGEAGTDADVQPTRLRSAGASVRYARADHSHPTAILPQNNSQTPVVDEIRYTDNNKIVRWDGSNWVQLSVETLTVEWGTNSDVQPTARQSAGTSFRFARADHSHPTAILPLNDPQTPVANEIRFDPSSNQLFRRIPNGWTAFTSGLPVPALPLVLPFTNDVISPLNRQLVNHSSWDNIGDATIFYRDATNNQYRLVFARPLAVCITSTPSGRNVWSSQADELVLKEGTGSNRGGVLWRRRGGTTDWLPVAPQLSDNSTVSLPTDVGVLARSPLIGVSGSRGWFIRGATEGGFFRAPYAGIATFSSGNIPPFGNLSTELGDGYAYFIHDFDRVDIVRPTTDGNKYPTMLTHYIIAPPCRIFSTATDASGHYVADEQWQGTWVISFFTTTSATTNLIATLPSIVIPYGIRGGRALLYLHNPQSTAITTVFAVSVLRFTSSGVAISTTNNTTVNISANTTVVADLGYFTFDPSTTLSHIRAHPITVRVIRVRSAEGTNANKVMCRAVVIIPQRAS